MGRGGGELASQHFIELGAGRLEIAEFEQHFDQVLARLQIVGPGIEQNQPLKTA